MSEASPIPNNEQLKKDLDSLFARLSTQSELILTQRKLIDMQENEIVDLQRKLNTAYDAIAEIEDELERAKNFILNKGNISV